MKCPNCNKELILPNRAYLNLEGYNSEKRLLVASECCNTGFTIKKIVNYEITPYAGDLEEDDWGVKLNKS